MFIFAEHVFLPTTTQCPFHGPVVPRDEKGVPVSKPVSSSTHTGTDQSVQGADTPAATGQWPPNTDLQDAIRDAAGAELLQTKTKKRKGG